MPKLEIFLNGEISASNEPEWGLFSTQFLVDQINAGPDDIDEVVLVINSPGGDVVEGFAMHDFLRSLGKKITTKGVGRVASIATVIFLAGDQRFIAENTEFMIHNPWTFAEGDADELEQRVEELRRIENQIADFYAAKIGADSADLLELMSEETTFTADQAIDMGFATSMLEPQNKAAIKQYKKIAGGVACKAVINTNTNMSKKPKLTALDKIKKAVKALKGDEEAPKALDVTLESGDVIQVETGDREEIAVGDAVTVNNEPVEDGTWTLQDGTVIQTVDGMISEITPAGGGDDDDESAAASQEEIVSAVTEAVSEALKPVLDFVDEQKKVNNAQQKVNESVAEAMELVTSTGFENNDGDQHKPQNYARRTAKTGPKTDEQINDEVVANLDKPLKDLVAAQKGK